MNNFEKLIKDAIKDVLNDIDIMKGRIGIDTEGLICIELPAPDNNTFALAATAHHYGYECSIPGGIRDGVRFDVDDPETFTICDEVDALVTIPSKLLKLFPDLDEVTIEGIKDTIHTHWYDPADAEVFIQEGIAQHLGDKSWD